MTRSLTLLTALGLCLTTARAQTTLDYSLSFSHYMHHEAVVDLTVHQAPAGPLTFRMSRSSPGRYATHEFGKNVYDISAKDASGNPLQIRQVDGDVYELPQHGSTVTVEYTLFGDRTDGTYVGIDRTHAHLNMPGTILWLAGQDKAPIKITFQAPEGLHWAVATQLVPTADPFVFTAPGLQYLMDCPTELSDFRMANFEETNTDGKKLTFRVSLHADISDDTWKTLVDNVRKVVEEEKKVFGEYASYDYGTYTFILDANAWASGDGMEHRNSTCITLPMGKVTGDDMPRILDVVAHEFFHSWNVKRIRPKAIEPFNFTKSDMCDELWVAEGFTQYYGNLLLTRAGFKTKEEEVSLLGNYLNAFLQSPGSRFFTPIESSRRAVFTDAGVSIDKNNFANTFLSYYVYGANIACILDLHLRKDYNKTLDDFMKALWIHYGKVARWYDVQDLETTLAGLTTADYARAFFANYVYGIHHDDWQPYFAAIGVQVSNDQQGKAGWGNVTYATDDSGHVAIGRGCVRGTALYAAGLDAGDAILSLDGTPVRSAHDISTFLSTAAIGKTVQVGFSNRGISGTLPVTLEERQEYEAKIAAGFEAQQQAWLGAQ
ncbi:M61 family metallopeptidase [Dinghuibacter silviterrae]|uniref:Putative metalloprotease with PDZ domain n=1 Tax=Dinghuibacter silviterrae TaxID=1539049 RepID=A0A4R8DHM7_9BACT|nr:PDZ domain-containing protein [Dinghuibacter silviterrae]TDW97229.1 putative metalloprotease with PDZ domain [Dinghuibacter silviterrae]